MTGWNWKIRPNSRNDFYQFWIQDNQPKVIYTEAFAAQKLEYIHNNPVDAGIVKKQRNILIAVPEIIIMANNAGLLRSNFCYRFNVRKYLVAN